MINVDLMDSKYQPIHDLIYEKIDEISCDFDESDYDSEKEAYSAMAEKAIDWLCEEIKYAWGINV